MLSISTIPEALAELAKVTGREWTDSELFDVATRYGIELHATRPITAEFVTEKFVAGGGLVTISEPPWEYDWLLEPFIVPDIDAELAVIFPVQVNQLRIGGETLTSYPANYDQIEGQISRFTQPVRVTRDTLRIKAEALHSVLEAWRKNQPSPAQDTATPAPVGTAGDGTAKPLQRTAAQDAAILCEIKKQGYDPLALPKNDDGKPGVRRAVRDALTGNNLFVGTTVFNKAWERLASCGDIVIQG